MLLNLSLALLLTIVSPLALADFVDFNINNTAAQFKLGMSASGIGDGNAELQGGLLYNDTSDLLAEAGLVVKGSGGGEEGGAGLIAGGGLKVVAGAFHQTGTVNNLTCIAIGSELGYTLPTAIPIALIGEYFISPKILTFADSERYNQIGIRVELAASPQAKIYLGYREIGFGIRNASGITFDMGTHVGIVISF